MGLKQCFQDRMCAKNIPKSNVLHHSGKGGGGGGAVRSQCLPLFFRIATS